MISHRRCFDSPTEFLFLTCCGKHSRVTQDKAPTPKLRRIGVLGDFCLLKQRCAPDEIWYEPKQMCVPYKDVYKRPETCTRAGCVAPLSGLLQQSINTGLELRGFPFVLTFELAADVSQSPPLVAAEFCAGGFCCNQACGKEGCCSLVARSGRQDLRQAAS